MDRLPAPSSAVKQILDAKIKTLEEFEQNWQKVNDYIKPFVMGNEEIEKAISKLNTSLTFFAMEDMMLVTIQATEKLALSTMLLPKFCSMCQKELDNDESQTI